jgi:hypothetical protein
VPKSRLDSTYYSQSEDDDVYVKESEKKVNNSTVFLFHNCILN